MYVFGIIILLVLFPFEVVLLAMMVLPFVTIVTCCSSFGKLQARKSRLCCWFVALVFLSSANVDSTPRGFLLTLHTFPKSVDLEFLLALLFCVTAISFDTTSLIIWDHGCPLSEITPLLFGSTSFDTWDNWLASIGICTIVYFIVLIGLMMVLFISTLFDSCCTN